MYYAKHSLVIFIIGVVGGFIGAILNFIPKSIRLSPAISVSKDVLPKRCKRLVATPFK